jgi:putative flippase GtrA
MTKSLSIKKLLGNKKFRFVIVGGTNTVIDFVFYNIFSKIFGLILPVANMISSFIAMLFSFFMNKKYTFHAKNSADSITARREIAREIVLFFIFTLIGIWVIQSGTIWLIQHIFAGLDWDNFWLKNGAKLVASVPSLIWNYVTYNKFVFSGKK